MKAGKTSLWTFISVVAAVATVINLWAGGKVTIDGSETRSLSAAAYLLAGVAVLGLALCQRHPRAALVVVFGASVTYSLLDYPSHPGQFAVGVVLFGAFVQGARTEAAVMSVLAGLAAVAIAPRLFGESSLQSLGRTAMFLVATLPAVAGYIVWTQQRRVVELQERLALTRRLQVAGVERDSALQRMAIARDLHDTVGHGFSVISVQSGAALSVLETDVESARGALLAINESCRTAMTETKGALAALRGGANERPPPVEATLMSAKATGLDVRLEQSGTLDDVEVPIADTIRRLAQESLTNTLKHSDASQVDVVLDIADESVRFEFTDVAHTPRPTSAQTVGGGSGLRGMSERVVEVGGRFKAGPTDTGFHVSALLPLSVAL